MTWHMTILTVVVVALSSMVASQHDAYEQPVVIPRCCPEGFNFDSEHNCIADPNKPLQPPGYVDDSPVVIRYVQNTDVRTISCTVGEKLVFGDTNTGTTFIFVEQDSVRLASVQHGELFKPPEYCVAREISDDHNANPNYVAKFCMRDLDYHIEMNCFNSTCVRKCCAAGKTLMRDICIETPDIMEEWHPKFISTDNTPVSPPSDLKIIHGFPSCEHLLVFDDDEHKLLPTGELDLTGRIVPAQDYCIDHTSDDIGSIKEIALNCLRTVVRSRCPWKTEILKPIIMGISCVCLLITGVVYVLVWELRTSTSGRCIISFTTAMFVSFISLMALNLHTDSSYGECVVTGRLTHFSVLAMFFWLNVMSFHVFSTARSGPVDGVKRFVLYSLYGWGVPLIIVIIGLVLDLTEANFIRPDMFHNCWIIDTNSMWLHLYGIILLILIVNIGFFIASVKFLRQSRYTLNTANPNNNISAWVYFKVFIFTGILWVTDVIFWATTHVGLTHECDVLHTISDIINGLQGVLVFLVAICFRKDLKVFHCGMPMMISVSKGNEVASSPHEVTELVNSA